MCNVREHVAEWTLGYDKIFASPNIPPISVVVGPCGCTVEDVPSPLVNQIAEWYEHQFPQRLVHQEVKIGFCKLYGHYGYITSLRAS